jgi:hypothetical protein
MDSMDIIKRGKNGKHVNTLEEYQIYRIIKDNLQMNGTHIDNPISETLYELYTQ